MSATIAAPQTATVVRSSFAWRSVGAVLLVLFALLIAVADRYGFHGDELYFRMLHPAWGYVDQPPLMPLLVHGITRFVDEPWAIRVPMAFVGVAAAAVSALLAREFGGRGAAQALAALACGFSMWSLVSGHLAITLSLDTLTWPLMLLGAVRVALRAEPRWWLLSGVTLGLASYGKLLIAEYAVVIVVAIALVGPRRLLATRWFVLSGALAIVLAAPNLVYQVTAGFPQIRMASAPSDAKGLSAKVALIPHLVIYLGPFAAVCVIVGVIALLRRPEWRDARFAGVAALLMLAVALVAGGQTYYPFPALVGVAPIGAVPVAGWAASRRGARTAVWAGAAVSAAVCAIVALPLLPSGVAARSTLLRSANPTLGDSIGWPEDASVVRTAAASMRGHWIVLAGDYALAGAVDRYAPALASRTYSGQNALGARVPPDSTDAVLAVGTDMQRELGSMFDRCAALGALPASNGPEQHAGIVECTGRRVPMSTVWASERYLGLVGTAPSTTR